MSGSQPSLPYAGGSGWSGSESSRQRQEREDSSGVTGERQRQVLRYVSAYAETGRTVREIREHLSLHHGQASGALTNLHKDGRLVRLSEERDRCKIYVVPGYEDGREVEPAKRRQPKKDNLRAEVMALLGRWEVEKHVYPNTTAGASARYIVTMCQQELQELLDKEGK